MVRRPLGRSGIFVSSIGLGTTKLGRNTDVKYPRSFALPSDDEVTLLLQHAQKLGVNLVDTAPAYGESETRLGNFISNRREQIVLCTKCGERYENGKSTYDFSASAMIASVDQSLRRLRTEYIDVLLLHSNGHDVEILQQTDVLETMSRLKIGGKIRAAGISAKTESGVMAAVRNLDVVMAPFNQSERHLAAALTTAHNSGLGVLAIKGLSSGHLEARGAMEYVLRQEFIDSLIVGTINPAHLTTAVDIAEQLRGR